MHDIRQIRDNPAAFDAALKRRGLLLPSREDIATVHVKTFATTKAQKKALPLVDGWQGTYSKLLLEIDVKWRKDTGRVESLQRKQKLLSDQAANAKRSKDTNLFVKIQEQARTNRKSIAFAERRLTNYETARKQVLEGIPNLPYDDVPDGPDESHNEEIHRHGNIRNFPFQPREHFDIVARFPPDGATGQTEHALSGIAGAQLSGSRFTVMSGSIARLHRALGQFMLDTHTQQHGYLEVWTPVVVNEEVLVGTGQLPKFKEDLYRLDNGQWLIPTAEVTLTGLAAKAIFEDRALPRRYTAHTQCFRSEAGAAGKDVRGMLRQHQFEKVEMVSITKPEDSRAELDRMTKCAERILELLGLPYRTIVLCTGDMGFGARRTHDIEVWLPGQNTFREISSCSVCGDFQARRMNARYKTGSGKPEFVHTLNGSGLAVGRTLIAVVENGQEEDGSIALPEVLFPYLGGKTRIAPDGTLC